MGPKQTTASDVGFEQHTRTGSVGEHVEDFVLDVFQRSLVVRDVYHLEEVNKRKATKNDRTRSIHGVLWINAWCLLLPQSKHSSARPGKRRCVYDNGS